LPNEEKMTNLQAIRGEAAKRAQRAPISHQQGYAAKTSLVMAVNPGRVDAGVRASREVGLHFFLYLRRVFLYYFS
jgi:hypothetical protein